MLSRARRSPISCPTAGVQTHLGGGPFTAARTLARLGRPVWFAGALSTDGLGTQLRAALVADGVRLDAVTLVDAPTTLAVADVDAEGAAALPLLRRGDVGAGADGGDAAARAWPRCTSGRSAWCSSRWRR